MYLGPVIQKVTNDDGKECWKMLPENYPGAAIKNVEEQLEKHELNFPTRCDTPLSSNFHPSEDTVPELDASCVQYFQEIIGVLRLAMKLGRLVILL